MTKQWGLLLTSPSFAIPCIFKDLTFLFFSSLCYFISSDSQRYYTSLLYHCISQVSDCRHWWCWWRQLEKESEETAHHSISCVFLTSSYLFFQWQLSFSTSSSPCVQNEEVLDLCLSFHPLIHPPQPYTLISTFIPAFNCLWSIDASIDHVKRVCAVPFFDL